MMNPGLRQAALKMADPALYAPTSATTEAPTHQERVAIFSPGIERVSLISALFLTSGSLLSLFFLTPAMNAPFYSVTMNFFIQIVFMNITHNAFSMMLPLVAPEVRVWWKESRHFGLTTTAAATLVFATVFLVILFLDTLAVRLGLERAGKYAFAVLMLFLTQRHALGQAFGLSRFYDQRLRERFGPPDERSIKLQLWQRRCFTLLMLLTFPRLVIFDLVNEHQVAMSLMIPLCGLSLVVVAAIVVMAYRETHGKHSNKFIFLLRLVSQCFTSYTNIWLYMAVVTNHAVEYALVSLTITRKSYRNEKKIRGAGSSPRRYWGWALSLLVLVIVSFQFKPYMLGKLFLEYFPGQSFIMSAFIAISIAMGITHYFVDERMFKMRKPDVRKHILPLLDQERL